MGLCRTNHACTGWAYLFDQMDIVPAEAVFQEIGMCLDPAILPAVGLNLVEELATTITEANGPACHILPHCRCGHNDLYIRDAYLNYVRNVGVRVRGRLSENILRGLVESRAARVRKVSKARTSKLLGNDLE